MIDRRKLGQQPRRIECPPVDHIGILDVRRARESLERISGNPVDVQSSVGGDDPGKALRADVLPRRRGEYGQRQKSVIPLKRFDVVPVRLDDADPVEPEEGIAHLVPVERRIGVAVTEAMPVGTDGKVTEKDFRVHRSQDVLYSGSFIRDRQRGIRNVQGEALGGRPAG